MKSYADFNGIRHDDGDKIIGFNRMKAHVVWMGGYRCMYGFIYNKT